MKTASAIEANWERMDRFEIQGRDRLNLTRKKEISPPRVLIIDDDVDSALQIESIFSHVGCLTNCALDWADARKKVCSLKPEVIILDWLLDHHMQASEIVTECSQIFDKYKSRQMRKGQIITYSALMESEISLPQSPYFTHRDHWQKPIRQSDLLMRVLALLKNLNR